MSTPFLVVVTGPPASGKTTMARGISGALKIPSFHKDDFKELLADSIPGAGLEWSQQLGSAAFELIHAVARYLAAAGTSFLIGANFHPNLSLSHFSEIAALVPIVQVVCHGDPVILERRYFDRHSDGRRHPVHLDTDPRRRSQLADAFRFDHEIAVESCILRYDTTLQNPVDPNVVAADIRSALCSIPSSFERPEG